MYIHCMYIYTCFCRSGQMGDKEGEDLGSLVFVAPLRDPELGCRMCRWVLESFHAYLLFSAVSHVFLICVSCISHVYLFSGLSHVYLFSSFLISTERRERASKWLYFEKQKFKIQKNFSIQEKNHRYGSKYSSSKFKESLYPSES